MLINTRKCRVFIENKGIHGKESREWFSKITQIGISSVSSIRHVVYYNIAYQYDISEKKHFRMIREVFLDTLRTHYYSSLEECIGYEGNDTSHRVKNNIFFDYIALESFSRQYDKRADSTLQCIELLDDKDIKCSVASGDLFLLYHYKDTQIRHEDYDVIVGQMTKSLGRYCANIENDIYVSSVTQPAKKPHSIVDLVLLENKILTEGKANMLSDTTKTLPLVESKEDIAQYVKHMSISMNEEDIEYVKKCFSERERCINILELYVCDKYWAEYCTNDMFLLKIQSVVFTGVEDEAVQRGWKIYKKIRRELLLDEDITLRDIATIGIKYISKNNEDSNIDVNRKMLSHCMNISVSFDNIEKHFYYLCIKNKLCNYLTKTDSYEGVSTCIGDAMYDILSKKAYVFSSMRISGSGVLHESLDSVSKGKVSQKIIMQTAIQKYSDYGNQAGVPCLYTKEIYHKGFIDQSFEAGFVMGIAPQRTVEKNAVIPGDMIILIGEKVTIDKVEHEIHEETTATPMNRYVSHINKENPTVIRKLQRFFRQKEVCNIVKECNTSKAGGIIVAIGKCADGVEIWLDTIVSEWKEIDELDILLSKYKEYIAIVVSPDNIERISQCAKKDNLKAICIGSVTDQKRTVITWEKKEIVNIEREFLVNSGRKQQPIHIKVSPPQHAYALSPPWYKKDFLGENDFWERAANVITKYASISKKKSRQVFDTTIGAATVLLPHGGVSQYGREEGSAVFVPFPQDSKYRSCQTVVISTLSCLTYLLEQSPFHGASYTVVDALSRLVAMGADPFRACISFQGYFKKMKTEEDWSQPFAALLGMLDAQVALHIPCIEDGEDNSRNLHAINLPPTFAVCATATTHINNVRSNQITEAGMHIYLILSTSLVDGSPNYEELKMIWRWMNDYNTHIHNAAAIHEGGIFETIVNMCVGNHMGVAISLHKDIVHSAKYGSMVVVCDEIKNMPEGVRCIYLGKTTKSAYLNIAVKEYGKRTWSLSNILSSRKEDMTREVSPCDFDNSIVAEQSFVRKIKKSNNQNSHKSKTTRIFIDSFIPQACVPVFPGTNCEYDTIRALIKAGASYTSPIFCNINADTIRESIDILSKEIKMSQIFVITGGYSTGDSPNGAGKFIAEVLRNTKIVDAIFSFLEKDGLMLGMGNGFQALVKSGWLPFCEPGLSLEALSRRVTLTTNSVGRHISCMVRTKLFHTHSPWLSQCDLNEEYWMPISCGEGQFFANKTVLKEMQKKQQIVSTYSKVEQDDCTLVNKIEGIMSEDGCIFGRMSHVERYSYGAYKNIPRYVSQPMFESAVQFFL